MQTKSRKNLSKSQNILTKSFFLFSFLHQYTPIDSLEELPAPPFRAACSSLSSCLFLLFKLPVPPIQQKENDIREWISVFLYKDVRKGDINQENEDFLLLLSRTLQISIYFA